jgi:hypothetical protein
LTYATYTDVMRRMLPVYLCVGIGLLAGIFFGAFVIDFQPRVVGGIFGAGAGLSAGAFVAALATNTPLAGRGASTRRPIVIEDFEGYEAESGDVEGYAPSRNGHGSNGSTPRGNSVPR